MPSYKSGDNARPEYVQSGEYNVEVINAEECVSSKGNDMIELRLKSLPDGAIFFDHLVFAENSAWKIDAFRASIGEEIIPGQEVDLHADDLIGKQGRARLIVEEYNGRKRNKVAAWIIPQVQSKEEVSDDHIVF